MKTQTFTHILKRLTFMSLALSFLGMQAQEETEKKWFDNVNVSGSVDGYYRYNITADNRDFFAPGTSFVNRAGFALGMANVILNYEGSKVGFVADLVYGPRGEEAVFLSTGSSQIVNQLYVYWNVSEKVKLTFGNFNTYLGYEVISPVGNFNYSTSYMFSYGPFSHTGLKADFALNDEWSAMLAVMNPTDYTESNPFDTYIVGAQLGYSGETGSAFLNFRYGNEGEPGAVGPTFQADLTTGWDLTESFYLGINGTYLSTEPQGDGDASGFYGIALYPQLKTSESFTIGLRGEYFAQYNGGLVFADGGGFISPIAFDNEGDGDVIAITLTGSYDVGDLTLKPEFRLDSSEDVFLDKDDEVTSTLASFVVGAIYKF
ncbi:porin [Aquimarina brevivitae]|uniref:Putative OmpL-like beta-barrel porin-2 n=1 Tax=Aquimarina brevivitae TaxID=323412 RepID=A0A4Q7PHY6_9FLAO|nr:porin [Aquimarina brevivitae]RZT00212.1 putative OmpL-like beta-barrel porin-2 [Aquimarina brevivitae]